MGLWVLEDTVLEHVPGTTRYFDDPDRPQVAGEESLRNLKCDTSGKVPIILVPQPSNDPNDPLNWPLWRRDFILFILSVVSVFATALGPILAANTLTLTLIYSERKPTTFTEVAILTGWYLFGVGIAGMVFVASARVWGKRHLFLLGTALLIVSSAWAGASGLNYESMLAARVFQGVATAPFEALVNAVVGDMYFVHERGIRMALSNLAVFGGAFFTPILVGKITHTIGWEWTFYLVAIFSAASFPLIYFLVPETAFVRSAHLNIDMTASDDRPVHEKHSETGHEMTPPNGSVPGKSQQATEEPPKSADTTTSATTHLIDGVDMSIPKKTFAQSLRIFDGRKSNENFFKIFLRPFPLFAQPAILWGCLIQGAMIGWTVFIGIILGAIFLGPPLFWGEVQTGYAYTGAFVGALAGFAVAGALADWSAKYMTRRNNGIYEPEFRLVLVIPQLILGCAGLYGFGITSARVIQYGWFWPVFFFGLEVAGMVIGAVASSLYLVDAHRDIAIECFTCLMIFKNFFSFGLTYKAYEWLVETGINKTFLWIASIQVFICLLSVPMYVFGKRNRSYFHRHDLLKMTNLN